MEQDERRQRARQRARQLRHFYISLATYIVINVFLFIVDAVTSPGDWWFFWVTFGWGIGMLFYAYSVFIQNKDGVFGQQWEDRKTQEILHNMDEENQENP